MNTFSYRYMTREDVQKALSVSKSTFKRMVKAGKIPQPIVILHNTHRWRSCDIAKIMDHSDRESVGSPRCDYAYCLNNKIDVDFTLHRVHRGRPRKSWIRKKEAGDKFTFADEIDRIDDRQLRELIG